SYLSARSAPFFEFTRTVIDLCEATAEGHCPSVSSGVVHPRPCHRSFACIPTVSPLFSAARAVTWLGVSAELSEIWARQEVSFWLRKRNLSSRPFHAWPPQALVQWAGFGLPTRPSTLPPYPTRHVRGSASAPRRVAVPGEAELRRPRASH